MENLDTIKKLAINFTNKFTHVLFCNNGTRELIISHHINQEPCVEILHHLQRDLLHFLNFICIITLMFLKHYVKVYKKSEKEVYAFKMRIKKNAKQKSKAPKQFSP